MSLILNVPLLAFYIRICVHNLVTISQEKIQAATTIANDFRLKVTIIAPKLEEYNAGKLGGLSWAGGVKMGQNTRDIYAQVLSLTLYISEPLIRLGANMPARAEWIFGDCSLISGFLTFISLANSAILHLQEVVKRKK